MKKLFALALALVLVLGFASCGLKNKVEEAAQNAVNNANQQSQDDPTEAPDAPADDYEPPITNPSADGTAPGNEIEDWADAMSQLNQLGELFTAGWPENEFTKQVPKPNFETSLGIPTDGNEFSVLCGASLEQLREYTKELKKAGFKKNESTTDQSAFGMTVYNYTASNGKGYTVEVNSALGVTSITIKKG